MSNQPFQSFIARAAVLSTLVLSFPLSIPAAKDKSVKTDVYSFNVGPGSKIIIENERGDITVEGWDKNTCELTVFKTSDHPENFAKIRITTDEQRSRLRVKTTYQEKLSGENIVDLILSVPTNSDLQLKTSTGKIQVKDLVGRVSLNTERGDISLSNVTGAIDGSTETGNIAFDLKTMVTQSINLKTDQGFIKSNLGDNINAFIWAEVEEGTIKSNLPLRSVQANEPGLLKGDLGSRGKLVHLRVGRGHIELAIPGGTGIRPDATVAAAQTNAPARTPPKTAGRQPADTPIQVSSEPSKQRTYSREVLSKQRVEANQPDPRQPVRNESAPIEPVDKDRRPTRAVTGSEQSGVVFNVDTNLIMLNTTIKDRRTSKTISDLGKEDFLIYEDHLQQTVAHFSPVETPFHLLLLLDISGSVRQQFDIIQEASIRFTQMLRPEDRIAVAVFNTKFELLSDFTSDRRRLSHAILSASPRGGTAFYDALHKSISSVFSGIKGRKAIVVFTDGVDNQLEGRGGSRITFPELFHLIEESNITIYSIFLDTEGDNRDNVPTIRRRGMGKGQIIIDILGGGIPMPPTIPGGRGRGRSQAGIYAAAKKQLNEIADQTGGQMYSPRQASDLNGVYQEIVKELSMQYSLGYYPISPADDGRWHRISVKIKDKPDYVARTRRGYYANLHAKNANDLSRDRPIK